VYDWHELCRLSNADLATVDVAEMNLACAVGLPGAEAIDFDGCVRAFRDYPKVVRDWTDAAYDQQFRADPSRYDHSEPIFLMTCLVSALGTRSGVRYDPKKINLNLADPFDLADAFVHAVVQGPGGTCGTLPVVYAAVARRLGYPVRLVKTKGHLFNRWEDSATGERINVEGSGPGGGINTYPDEHYGRDWKHPVSADDVRLDGYLLTLSPREELALFVSRRALRWRDVGNYRESIDCFVVAAELDPRREMYRRSVVELAGEWSQVVTRQWPPGAAPIGVRLAGPRWWPTIPWELERRIRCTNQAACSLTARFGTR
jgi:hypothetical protein